MSIVQSYRLRLKRKRFLLRARRKGRQLKSLRNQAHLVRPDDILCFTTLRNERIRLPYFLQYYRSMGVRHFFMVDNGSDDGTREYLLAQNDVSVWGTDHSYKSAGFGADWLNSLLQRYGHDHWTLTVDVDEFFIYPFCDTRPIRALTDWLDGANIRAFGAMLVDMYPKGPIDRHAYQEGQDPFEIAAWFDSGNYTFKPNWQYNNLWIQGGPRARVFFADEPEKSPALNKVPLVRWHRNYVYISSTHMLLPRGLNLVYEEWGGEKTSGCLLHAKFLNVMVDKSTEEQQRNQHYASSQEYRAYYTKLQERPDMWCKWSEKYINWRQMEILGLMSKGNWA